MDWPRNLLRQPENADSGLGYLGKCRAREEDDANARHPDRPRQYVVDDAIPGVGHEQNRRTSQGTNEGVSQVGVIVMAHRVLYGVPRVKETTDNEDHWERHSENSDEELQIAVRCDVRPVVRKDPFAKHGTSLNRHSHFLKVHSRLRNSSYTTYSLQ